MSWKGIEKYYDMNREKKRDLVNYCERNLKFGMIYLKMLRNVCFGWEGFMSSFEEVFYKLDEGNFVKKNIMIKSFYFYFNFYLV